MSNNYIDFDDEDYYDPTSEFSQVSLPTIWVNGCFDVIHAGHIDMIEYAKSLGQRLIIGLDTDERVQANKGSSRPINTLALRIKVMESTGETFDPELHEAITEIPAPTEDMKGKIIDTIEQGYYLNDKIIRYARVVVGN